MEQERNDRDFADFEMLTVQLVMDRIYVRSFDSLVFLSLSRVLFYPHSGIFLDPFLGDSVCGQHFRSQVLSLLGNRSHNDRIVDNYSNGYS